ncbi:hypothetical protein HK096_002507, partial [Nowakowskiella sp. JEL0078]
PTISRSGRLTKPTEKAAEILNSDSNPVTLLAAEFSDLTCDVSLNDDECEGLAFMLHGLAPTEIDPPSRKIAMQSRFRDKWLEAEQVELMVIIIISKIVKSVYRQ